MQTTPSTELDAVNEMLGTIGESPISTLEDSGLVDAAVAKQVLTSVSRSVQSKGWHFNTEVDYPISVSFPNNELVLPANTLKVDTTGSDATKDLVQRGSRLYDRRNHTYMFTESVKVEIVLFLPFEELPESARHYATIRAARIFQERTVGAQELSGFTSRDELDAKVSFQEANGDTADYNILSDSYSVANVLERT